MENLPKQNNIEEGLVILKKNIPILIQYNIIQARLTREKYLALVNEGFKSDEALKLCMEVKI